MRLFTDNKNCQNIFVAYIDLLGGKYTNKYANKCFNEHPHKYSLFGLSKMLTNYGVQNTGLKVNKFGCFLLQTYHSDSFRFQISQSQIKFMFRKLNLQNMNY